MESYNFYRSFYDRELGRKKDLDGAINTPIALITLITGINSYILKDSSLKINGNFTFSLVVMGVTGVLILIAIFFLFKCYNNLFKGFAYLNYPKMSEVRKFQKEIELVKTEIEIDSIHSFEYQTLENIISYTDSHTEIYDRRTNNLFYAKTIIIVSLIISIFHVFISLIEQLYK